MAKETTKVPSNPAAVVFTTDRFNFLSGLRDAGLRAAGRVANSDEKLELYLDTLDTLTKHVEARHASAVKEAKMREEAARERAAEEAARLKAERIENAKAALAKAEAEAEAARAILGE